MTELAIDVADAHRRLTGIDAGAEEIELECRLQVAKRSRQSGSYTEPTLAHAGPKVSVLAEFIVECRQLGGTDDVEPQRIVLLDVVDAVRHREAVDLEHLVGGRCLH